MKGIVPQDPTANSSSTSGSILPGQGELTTVTALLIISHTILHTYSAVIPRSSMLGIIRINRNSVVRDEKKRHGLCSQGTNGLYID